LPDQSRHSQLEQLNEEVSLLRAALTREKNLTKKLQARLEEKVQVNFEKNQDFINAFEQASTRQVQLQFLATLTENIYQETNIKSLVSFYLTNVFNLLDVEHALVLIETPSRFTASEFSEQELESIAENNNLQAAELFQELTQTLSANATWSRLPPELSLSLQKIYQWHHARFPIATHIEVVDKIQLIIVLDVAHYCYSGSFKKTLNSSCLQFAAAINRRSAEIELAENVESLTAALKELKETQHLLAHSEKMSSLGQLAAGVAHEINNPLSYIASNLETLKEYIETYNQALTTVSTDDEELSFIKQDTPPLINSCISGLKRISEIVASLKTFSKKDEDIHELLQLNEVIESALQIVGNQFKYQHTIDRQIPDTLPAILGSSGQLQQVFVNLFLNAAQAMKDGGSLSIELKAESNEVIVMISDTGIGMTQEVMNKLFDPFYTTKSATGGTGLGLSLSYAILEKHQAIIEVFSKYNEGTKFIIHFPRQSKL